MANEWIDQSSYNIQDAFHSAFSLSLVKKRRPLLIYIHHHNRVLDLLSSDILHEFLHENYIVWSWDITKESNRNILIKIWEENFPPESFIHFSMNQCPMLIGVMRRIPMENDSSSSLEYEANQILIGDVLVSTDEQLDLETLLCQLIVFKEEFDKNEKNLSFDFVGQIGLCWELVLEIAKYLSLNDVIAIFSYRILRLLSKETKLPIVKPSAEFMKTIMSKIKPERILSLFVEAEHFKETMELASPNTFKHVQSLTLENVPKIIENYQIQRYFPNSTVLSLFYNKEIDFHYVCKIFNLISDSIKQLKIRCDSIPCSHNRLDLIFTRIIDFNTTIEFLVLHVDHTSTSLINTCVQYYYKCILRTITDFIRIMSNIRGVYIIVNEGKVDTLLDMNEWRNLVERCNRLEKITLKVIRNSSSKDPYLSQRIEEIKKELHTVRQTCHFEVKVK